MEKKAASLKLTSGNIRNISKGDVRFLRASIISVLILETIPTGLAHTKGMLISPYAKPDV